MSTSFPGMDPYLEAPGVWPGFHEAFLSYLREHLQPLLPDSYYAELQTREEVGIAGLEPERVIYPDVAVKRTGGPASTHDEVRQGTPEGLPIHPEHLVIVEEAPLEVSFLEIRETGKGRNLVTLIELLSPSNKLPGPDRDAFERKQKDVFASDVNWVEIDLLRAGARLGGHPRVAAHARRKGYDYLVVLSRSNRRAPHLDLELFGFRLRDPLPVVSIPLREPDPDILLDLGPVFRRAYETGPYRKILSYDGPADPPLRDEDAAWARSVVKRLAGGSQGA
jgi:hypothetical protein